MEIESDFELGCLFDRFPAGVPEEKWDDTNPAIKLFGRRFYKDQTPIEYLIEFLMAFSSPKDSPEGGGEYQFRVSQSESERPVYYPKARIPLKLFTFFPTSKLETRHKIHRAEYLNSIKIVKSAIVGNDDERDEAVRLIQALFYGFVGVAKDRTWVTCNFLPVAQAFLAKEVTWKHSDAIKAKNAKNITDWKSSTKFFDKNTHNFMGRGGELLFLQLANLFSEKSAPEILVLIEDSNYKHLATPRFVDLKKNIEASLGYLLDEAVVQIDGLVKFTERLLNDLEFEDTVIESKFGWVPRCTRVEAFLFASELYNICSSNLNSLEKIHLLQILCMLQVMRSLCFQSRRITNDLTVTPGFAGNYAWIACDINAVSKSPIRQMAESSSALIEGMIYRAVRHPSIEFDSSKLKGDDKYKNADENAFLHFRKFGKTLGLIVPIKGPGQRFVLNPELIRFLVTVLVRPGEYLRLTDFYQRVFAHYGIALGGESLATALAWSGGGGEKSYGLDVSTAWVEEALQQGGFLIELSDAVSIVHNPGAEEEH